MRCAVAGVALQGGMAARSDLPTPAPPSYRVRPGDTLVTCERRRGSPAAWELSCVLVEGIPAVLHDGVLRPLRDLRWADCSLQEFVGTLDGDDTDAPLRVRVSPADLHAFVGPLSELWTD
jgi:hypothetical protein